MKPREWEKITKNNDGRGSKPALPFPQRVSGGLLEKMEEFPSCWLKKRTEKKKALELLQHF
jgi:hypothetical protein